MLTTITLENFKSYRSARLPLGPLTVLIGANASGKSNAIEGMRLLSWLAQGQRLTKIQYDVQSGDRLVRGTVASLPHQGQHAFGLGAYTNRSDWNHLSLGIELRNDGLHIAGETLAGASESVPLYTIVQSSHDRGTDCGVAYNNFSRGQNKPKITCSDQAAIFTQLTSPATFAAKDKTSSLRIPAVVKELEQWLSNILFLDPVPARMRDYSFPSDTTLKGDGSNLSAVLYGLWGGDRDPDTEVENGRREPFRSQRSAILSFIQSLPEQDITDINFLEEPRGGVMVKLIETFGNEDRGVDASLLSDGTLRVLSIAAAMLSAPKGSLVVIEEIDNGVHPSRAKQLLANIRNLAEERELRVLLSTHNPALLDALPDAALPEVLFCYRDREDGSSRIVQLQEVPDYPELVAQDSLGGLVTSGVLERFVKYPQERDRKARALAWLESVRSGGVQ